MSTTRAAAWPTPGGCSSSSPINLTSRAARVRSKTVDAINNKITAGLPITETVVCPHDDADDCACRKPRPGMLLAAASRWDIDLAASVMIGDRWRDIEAGRAAGTRTFFVEHGDSSPITCRPDHVVDSLTAAAELILRGGVIA